MENFHTSASILIIAEIIPFRLEGFLVEIGACLLLFEYLMTNFALD